RLEVGALDEGEGVGVLVCVELRLPVALADDYAAPYLLRFGEELLEGDGHGSAGQVAERGLVDAVDEEARVLKLDGEEEGRARVNPLDVAAVRVRAARLDVVRPELEARGVGLAREEVAVVLRDEELRVVNRVRPRSGDAVRQVNRQPAGDVSDLPRRGL